MAPLSPTQASRKYVDLINGPSGSYANWDPLRRIEVGQSSPESRPFCPCRWLTPFLHGSKAGDFGQIDPETGQFVREGNIYRDEPLASIAKDYPPQTTEPVYELKIDSGSTSRMSTLP